MELILALRKHTWYKTVANCILVTYLNVNSVTQIWSRNNRKKLKSVHPHSDNMLDCLQFAIYIEYYMYASCINSSIV
jgi:hypothetical protein